jgi:hypothetical protein
MLTMYLKWYLRYIASIFLTLHKHLWVAPTRVYWLFHTSRSCNIIPLYNSHDRRVYIPSSCIVYLQDGHVNRIPLYNSHDRRVYIPSSCVVYLQDGRVNRIPLCNSHDRRVYIPSSCVVYLQDDRVNSLFGMRTTVEYISSAPFRLSIPNIFCTVV